MTLRIAPNLSLPIEAVTETFAILAKRGKGKTNTAVVMTEEMIKAGQQVVVIDPVGVWWGLSSSSNGQGEGLPVVIFGGDHGHVPLEETAGEVIADVVIEHQTSVVIDLSLLRKGQAQRFMTDFMERLYHRNRDPLHVVVDEADAFAPQRTFHGGERLLGAMEDLVRRGRARGLGCTLITQRPASINKDVLTQAEVLICLGMTGVQDINAIDSWVKQHADEGEAAKVKASLPSLPVGTAWVWSPGWLGQLKQVKIRKRRTFDSSATPKPGERRIVPKKFAQVDLDALGDQIRATVEKRKAEDPKALRARIRELEQQNGPLRSRITELEQQVAHEIARADAVREQVITEIAPVPIPVVGQEIRLEIKTVAGELTGLLASVLDALERVSDQDTRLKVTPSPPPRSAPVKKTAAAGVRAREAFGAQARVRTEGSPHPLLQTAADFDGEGGLSDPEQRVVDAIAWLNEVGFPQPTKIQTGFIAGYRTGKKVGGAYGNILGRLRSRGIVTYPSTGTVELTYEGAVLATPADIERTTAGLQAAVNARLTEPERRVIAGIIDAYPDPLSKQDAGALAGYTVGPKVGGAFGNILGKLRTLGLIAYPTTGQVVATDLLFLD